MVKRYYILNVERTQKHQCLFWWKSNRMGYTSELSKAGKYTEEDFPIVADDGEDIPIDCEKM